MAVDHNPNHRPQPRHELLSPEGLALLKRDPDAYLDAQRVLVEETQGWDKETINRKISQAKQREIVAEMLERFTLVSELEGPQRRREVEDLKFDRALLEDQWDAKDLRKRQDMDYPCLVVSRLDQPIQQVINEANDSRIAVQIKPRGRTANKDGAEVRQGLYRSIEVDSNADDGRLWGLERTIKAGRGAWRVVKFYRNDGDFDLDLGIERILNQGAVYFDPWATKPDWADGEWCHIIEDLPLKTYKRMYPKSDILSHLLGDPLTSEGNVPPDWLPGDSVRIVEYFRVVYEPRVLLMDPDSRKGKLLPRGMTAPDGAKTRTVQKRSVEWYVCNAVEVLDTETWEGRYIPVIPCIGKEYNIDGKERVFKGMISNSKDAQRMYNYFKSLQVQAGRLTTQETYLADPRAIEGFGKTDAWKGIKILPYRSEVNGVKVDPPAKMFKEPELQSITLTLHEIADDIRATTGRQSASLGEYGPERSGKAVRELKQQGENTTSNYLRNYVRALGYEARVILDLMPYVYDGERIVRLLGDEDKERSVLLNGDFYETPDGPVPAAEMQQPGFMERAKGMLTGKPRKPPEKKRYDIRADEDYAYVVSVGRSYQTQKEEDAAVFEAIIKAQPDLAPVIAPLWLESLEGPAAARAAEILKKMNPLLKNAEEGEPEIPPEIQQQMQQSQQMIQELTEALNQKTAEQAIDAQKIEAARALEEMKLAAQAQMKQVELDAKALTEQTVTDREIALATLKAVQEQKARDDEQAHERQLQQEKIAAETASRERIEVLKLEAERESTRLKMEAERESTRLKIEADRETAQMTAQTQREIAERKQTMTVNRDDKGYIKDITR